MAATLYPDDAPPDVQPVTCFGDGNCLFRTSSIIFFGNEDHHTEFRIRAICELAKNEKSYLNNDFLHSLTGAKNVVESLLPSSVFVNVKDSSVSYRREVLRTLKPFTFANMWHMFSLANVLGCTVQSVYPYVQNPGTNRSLINIFIRPAVAADPSVKIMWSHCSNMSKRGWGPNHFVPLIPVGAVGKQKGEWVKVKRKRKIGKRNAESPVRGHKKRKAESPVKGNEKRKVESPVKGNEKRKAESPVKGNEKRKVESPITRNEKRKAESPVKEITGKEKKGAGKYDCTFKKDWTKEWSFITAANDPHSFHCVICARDVSCKHQGRTDVVRHIKKDIHQNNTKRHEGQNKLQFCSKQDPLAEKVYYIF